MLSAVSAQGALYAIPETTTVGDGPRRSRIEWVTPHLSAEVRALTWPPGRALRHVVFQAISWMLDHVTIKGECSRITG